MIILFYKSREMSKMSSITANVTDVTRHFSEYLNRAAYAGESFVIVRGGRALAELKPLPRSKRISELASILSSLPKLSEVEKRGFKSDLVKIRKSVAGEKNPWGA